MSYLTACSEPGYDPDETPVAEVGDAVLTLEELENRISGDEVTEENRAEVEAQRDRWIRRQLLYQEAKRIGLDEDPEFQQRIQQIKEDYLSEILAEYVMKEFEEEQNVTRQDAQQYYEENKEDFVLNERHFRFRHLVADTRADAEAATQAIRQGRNWREVAETYDIDPDRAIGESRQYYGASEAVAEYEEMNSLLQRIGINEISPIRNIGDHYHFVQLRDERRAGDHPEPEWVMDQIQEWLSIQQKRNYLSSFERNLAIRAESNNEIRLYDVDNFEPLDEFEPDTLISN